MIKPNRKSKGKKYQFNPIEVEKHELSSGVVSEQDQDLQESNILKKLTSQSSKVRQEITSILANTNILPQQIKDKDILKQLLVRIIDDKPPIAYNSIFALNNFIQQDPSFLRPLSELGMLGAITSLLKKLSQIESVKIRRRVLQGAYLLIQTILTNLSFQALNYLQNTEDMKYIVTLALDLVTQSNHLHDSNILFQVLAYVSQHSKLRKIIEGFAGIEGILVTVTNQTIKALLCNILFFSKPQLEEKVIQFMSEFINQSFNDINLQSQFKQNIAKYECGQKEQELDMQAEIDQNQNQNQNQNDKVEEQIDEQEVIQTNKSQQPITNQIFLQSVQVLQILSNLILSLVEQNQNEEEDIQENQEIEEEIQNSKVKLVLKQKLTGVAGVLRNSMLEFKQAEVLAEQSWRIIRNIMRTYNHNELLHNATLELESILHNKLPFNYQLLLSITQNSLQIVYKIWKQFPQTIKCPMNILFQLLNPNILQKANTKTAAMIFDMISLKFNPEQQPVTQNENKLVGTSLRDFIIKSSDIELQCQCLDTIFSVYSNENFDLIFKQLGFMELLSSGLNALSNYKHKNKFTKAVQHDLVRFLEYKNQKLREQKLL